MSDYFLGVDTGSTKSHALITDGNGRAIGFGRGGPGNWEGVGWDGTRAVLEAIIHQALEMAEIRVEQITAAGLGLAGYDWPEDRQPHVALIRSLGLAAPFELVNDALVGLLAGSTAGWGLVVSAGTGCNCYGRDEVGRIGRVTGGGNWAGEYAGGGELVSQAIKAVAQAWTRLGPTTCLTDAFTEAVGARDAADLLAGLARGRYDVSAAHARLVFEVAGSDDAIAQEIIQWAGRELGYLANGVIRQLDLQDKRFEIVLSGSLFDGGPLLVDPMQETIHTLAPQARFARLNTWPVVGGVLLGMEQVSLAADGLRQRIIDSTNTLLRAPIS